MKQMVLKAENLLVDVLNEYDVAGIKRFAVRDAKNKKADTRVFLAHSLREPTEEDIDHVVFLYTDEDTGEAHTLKLQKEYIAAIPEYLHVGSEGSITTKEVLQKMKKEDTDGSRRQFRAAVAYWIEKGVVICSTSNGYFIAQLKEEVESCVRNKERQANANLRRAEHLKGMNILVSLERFLGEKFIKAGAVPPVAA